MSLFIEAFNSGDEDTWKRFIADNWTPSDRPDAAERRFGLFQMIYADMGEMKLHSVNVSQQYEISCLMQAVDPSAQFEWGTFTIMADTLPPHKVAMMSVRPADDPSLAPPEGKLTQEQIVAFMDEYLDEMTAGDKFSGTVLAAKDGVPFYTRVEGEACKRYGVPNKLDTKFNLGSMNKMFTGVAIMQLVEQGKVALDEPVGTYLPDLPRKDIAEKVTIDHLLSHRSGMQDYWEEIFNAQWWKIKTVDQLAELIYEDSLLFEPGTDYHYSNSGPIVLGQVIEKVTGQDYYEYVLEHICKPAGMINTDCYEVDSPVPNLAIGYTTRDYSGERLPEGEIQNNLFKHAIKGGPAGGGYSTVEDLLAFDIALRQNKLISKESFDLMTTAKTERGPGFGYAYLFGEEMVDGDRIIGHNGGAPGINAELAMFMESGYTVAVMSNYDRAASTVAIKLRQAIMQK
jgi:CubicO group peptidase (beta-lactamase class C family)